MKEQIEKILNNKSACLKGWSETGHPIYDTNSDKAQEIIDHIFQFNDWCIINCYKIYDGNWYGVCDEDKTFNTLEELYNFWYSNVFSKTKKG